MGRKDSQGTQDNPLLVIGGVVGILLIVYFVFATSPITLQYQTKWYLSQAKLYHVIAPEFMEAEKSWLLNLTALLEQQAKDKTKKINLRHSRALLSQNTSRTRKISAGVTGIIITIISVWLLAAEVKRRKQLYSRLENISAPKVAGLDGYIEFMSRHLSPEKLNWLKANSSSDRITSTFEYIRMKKNIPNAIVARLFPPFSEIRLNLLEVGKKKPYDRDAIFNKTPINSINNNEKEK